MAILATDNFNRTDSNPLSGSWATHAVEGNLQIVSQVVTPVSLAIDSCQTWSGATFQNDQWSECAATVGTAGTAGTGPGPGVRMAQATETFYRTTVNTNATNIALERAVSGTFTTLWNRTAIFNNGDTLRLEVQGSTLRVLINGVPVGADTVDGTPIASGQPGLTFSSGSVSAATMDNWAAGDFTTIPPTFPATADLVEGTGTRAFGAVTTQANDYIVVEGIGQDGGAITNMPPSAAGLVFTKRTDNAAGVGDTKIQQWTAPDATGGSRTVTVTATGGGTYNAHLTVVRGSAGPSGTATSLTAQTVSVTRAGNDSGIFMSVGDWSTGAVGTPVWTPGGATIVSQQGTNATYIFGRWSDSGPAGTASHGVSSPAYTTPSIAVLEMLGSSTVPVIPKPIFFHPRKPPWSRFRPRPPAITISAVVDQTIVPSGFDDDDAFGQPSISLTVNPNGAVSTEQFGSAAITTTVNIVPSGITTTERFGQPSIAVITAINPSGIPSTEQFGAATITSTVNVVPSGIITNEQFGNANVASISSVTPSGITTNERFGAPAITSTYTINAGGIPSTERFGNDVITTTVNVAVNGITTNEQFGQPSITVITAINAAGIPTVERFGAPSITSIYTINANGIPSSELAGNPNVQTASTVAVNGITTAEQFGSPAITSIYTINANGIPTNEQLGNANTASISIVTPSGIVSTEQFGTQTISVIVAINPTGITSAERFGAASVTSTYTINANGIVSAERFGSPAAAATSQINASGIVSSERFGINALVPGAVTIAPRSIISSEAFGRAIASLGLLAQQISANGIGSKEQFGAPFTGAPVIVDIIVRIDDTIIIAYIDGPVRAIIDNTSVTALRDDDTIPALDGTNTDKDVTALA